MTILSEILTHGGVNCLLLGDVIKLSSMTRGISIKMCSLKIFSKYQLSSHYIIFPDVVNFYRFLFA